ncbi:type IV toxin-antitoxin system AbiEi family antitoxin domain-containing protein [bacterium]|nr:type IV toxin-antitoxin system AbiEi family antitoxin domain-containing protein [bacterium]
MPAKGYKRLKSLLKKPSFTTAEASKKGVSSSLLSYYAEKGYIEKISRGVYRGNESERTEVPFEWEDLISTAASIPNGKICLISALALYELTDEMPRQFWIAIPHKQYAPKRPKAKIVRMRDVKTGSTKIQLGNTHVRIFDKERTIIDSFRFISQETAIKALKEYLSGRHGKPDLVKLRKYSRKLKTPIEKYVEAFTT